MNLRRRNISELTVKRGGVWLWIFYVERWQSRNEVGTCVHVAGRDFCLIQSRYTRHDTTRSSPVSNNTVTEDTIDHRCGRGLTLLLFTQQIQVQFQIAFNFFVQVFPRFPSIVKWLPENLATTYLGFKWSSLSQKNHNKQLEHRYILFCIHSWKIHVKIAYI